MNGKWLKRAASLWIAMLLVVMPMTALAGEKDGEAAQIRNSAHILYVSPEGNDGNDGSKEHPYQTIEKAHEAVRNLVRTGLKKDVYVMIGEGTYYIDEPIVIEAGDFDETYKVVYQNYGNQEVHLVGGNPVTGWEDPDGDGIYEADLEKDHDFYALFQDGIRLVNAKSTGWKTQTVKDISHLQAVYGGARDWFGEVLKVKSLNGSSMSTEISKGKHSGGLQYLQGAREYIDEAGEWAIEGEKVYYKPFNGENPQDHEIVAGSAERIFYLKGTPEEPVKNIVIDGLYLEMNDFGENLLAHSGHDNHDSFEFQSNLKGIVDLDNTENVTVSNCSISNAGYMAVMLNHYSQNNTVYGNKIEDTGYAGMFLIGDNPGSLNYYNKCNTISNNKIRNAGKFVGHGSGIYLINSGENTITHNDISETNRYGISLKGVRYGAFGVNGLPNVEFEEHWKYNQTMKNYIAYNVIHNTGKRSGDGGGIESWGIGRDNWIDHNIIYNAYRGPAAGGWRGHSIFMDDGTHHTMVTNNIVYDENAVTVNAGTMMKNIANYVVNNVFDVGYAYNGAANVGPYLDFCGGMTFKNNIIYANVSGSLKNDGSWIVSGNGDRVMLKMDKDYATGTPTMEAMETMNRNLYYNGQGKAIFEIYGQKLSFNEWKQSAENIKKYDADSKMGNPEFVDAVNRDYRLQTDSPAYELGIAPIETSEIGLLPDYRYAEEEDVPKKLFLSAKGNGIGAAAVKVGDTVQLVPTVKTEKGYAQTGLEGVTYKSSNDVAASVDDNGKVTILAEGTAVITASYKGLSDNYTIYAGESLEELIAEDVALEMTKNEAAMLNPLVKTSGGHYVRPIDITYTVKNGNSVTVDEKGRVEAQKNGSTVITVLAVAGDMKAVKDITVSVSETKLIPGVVEAENYTDMYGIEASNDVVTAIDKNDWTEYDIKVEAAGEYNVKFTVVSEDGEVVDFDVFVDGKLMNAVTLESASGEWQSLEEKMKLGKGVHKLKVVSRSAGWELDKIEFTKASAETGHKVEAEDYTDKYGDVKKDGLGLGYISAGDWMEYKVNIPKTGTYKMVYRVAVNKTPGKIDVSANGISLGQVEFPGTGGWKNWANVSQEVEFEKAGELTIRMNVLASGWNFDYFTIASIVEETDVDKAELQALYEEYSMMEQGNYTDESWAVFMEVRKDARNTLTDESTSQEAVDAVVAAMKDAAANLEENLDDIEGAFTITVDGKATEHKYNDAVTIEAPAEKDGKKFSCWMAGDEIVSYEAVYKFYVSKSMKFTAVYADETVEAEPKAMLTNVFVTKRADEKSDVKFVGELVIPEGYELVNAGLVWSSKEDTELVLDGGLKPTYITRISDTNQFSVTIKGMPQGKSIRGSIFATVSNGTETKVIYSAEKRAEAK